MNPAEIDIYAPEVASAGDNVKHYPRREKPPKTFNVETPHKKRKPGEPHLQTIRINKKNKNKNFLSIQISAPRFFSQDLRQSESFSIKFS